MIRASTSLQVFAGRLIEYETMGEKSSRPDATGTPPVLDKLRPLLTNLMGNGGFRALLARALALTNAEFAWTRAVHVKSDGTLEGWEELTPQVAAAEFRDGSITLLAHLLGLMVAFIGPTLTVQLLRDIWPKISLHDLNLDHEGKNAQRKTV